MKATTELLKEFADSYYDINLSSIDDLYPERKKHHLKAGFGVLCTSNDRTEKKSAREHILKTLEGLVDDEGELIARSALNMIDSVARGFKSNFQAGTTETHEIFFYISRMSVQLCATQRSTT